MSVFLHRKPFYSAAFWLLGTLCVIGCASTQRTAPVPAVVGVWDYVIPNTPQGDATGTLIIEQSESGILDGEMSSDLLLQTVPIRNLMVDRDVVSFDASFDAGGQMLDTRVTLTRTGDAMDGTIEVPGMGGFSVTARRKGSGS